MGEGGRGWRPVVRGRASVQLAAVEGAAAGGAPGEAEAVGRGGVADAVGGRHRVPLGAGRHGDAAEANRDDMRCFQPQTCTKLEYLLFTHLLK